MSVRSRLAANPAAHAVYDRLRPTFDAVGAHVPVQSLRHAPAGVALRLVYQVMLGREPDPIGLADFTARMRRGELDIDDVVAIVRCSEEFNARPIPSGRLVSALHLGRIQFVRSLPAARRIVDLGGTHLASRRGALVELGYPYSFDELVIVDLPADERHDLYRSQEQDDAIAYEGGGTIRYSYHSMTDLSRFADESVDLVYSGQSIEHVTPAAGRQVLTEVARILRPGGSLGLDTPNGRVTRLQQAEFIDPDHEVEYTWPQLRSMIEGAGLVVERAHGLSWVPAAAEGRFDEADAAAHPGLFDAVDDCYLMAVVARKPAPGTMPGAGSHTDPPRG